MQSLPEAARSVIAMLVETLHSLDEKIAVLNAEIARRAEEDDDARRLKTIPGIGPVTKRQPSPRWRPHLRPSQSAVVRWAASRRPDRIVVSAHARA